MSFGNKKPYLIIKVFVSPVPQQIAQYGVGWLPVALQIVEFNKPAICVWNDLKFAKAYAEVEEKVIVNSFPPNTKLDFRLEKVDADGLQKVAEIFKYEFFAFNAFYMNERQMAYSSLHKIEDFTNK